MPALAEYSVSLEAKLLRLSVPAAFFVNDFLLPFVGVILLYLLFYKIIGRKYHSLALAAFFYLIFLFSFGRPINPQFSFIFLVVGLLLIERIHSRLDDFRTIYYSGILGLVTGLLVYIYTYFWTALVVCLGMILLSQVIRQRRLMPAMKNFVCFIIPAGLLSVPYLTGLIKAAASPDYGETMSRFGLLTNHWPAALSNVFFILIVFAVIVFSARKFTNKNDLWFSYSLLSSALMLNWQNIITGAYLQFSSHYYLVTILLCLLSFAIVFKSWPGDKGTVGTVKENLPAFLLIALFLTALLYKQTSEISSAYRNIIDPRPIGQEQLLSAVFAWLDANTAADSVVYTLAGDQLAQYRPIYTNNNLYSYGYAGYYLLSDQEMEDRWVRQNIFKDQVYYEYILANQRSIWQNKFIDRFQNQSVRNKIIGIFTGKTIEMTPLVPPEHIERVLGKFKAIKKEDPRTALKKFRIDYILLDESDPANGGLENEFKKYGWLKMIEQSAGGLAIYHVE